MAVVGRWQRQFACTSLLVIAKQSWPAIASAMKLQRDDDASERDVLGPLISALVRHLTAPAVAAQGSGGGGLGGEASSSGSSEAAVENAVSWALCRIDGLVGQHTCRTSRSRQTTSGQGGQGVDVEAGDDRSKLVRRACARGG